MKRSRSLSGKDLPQPRHSFAQEKRFYPEYIPYWHGEADRDRFAITVGNEYGNQLISLVAFREGERVFQFGGIISRTVTLYTLQISSSLHVHDEWVMGYVIHSCEPNMVANVSDLTFSAARAIKPMDILTMDYETTEEELFRGFQCACGSPRCRGYISGRGQHIKTNLAATLEDWTGPRSRP